MGLLHRHERPPGCGKLRLQHHSKGRRCAGLAPDSGSAFAARHFNGGALWAAVSIGWGRVHDRCVQDAVTCWKASTGVKGILSTQMGSAAAAPGA
jgi:hypothetical protein